VITQYGVLGQIVYENEHVVAFLDKFPMVAGHTLVVPKKQVAKMHGEIPVSFSSPVLMVTSVSETDPAEDAGKSVG
jgi:histidine triad (HIT) family protein